MPDNRATRTSVTLWRKILLEVYNEPVRLGIGDVWVFGSQAMSLYMKRPLASKDIDLLASGTTIDIVKSACGSLAHFSLGRAPYYDFQNLEHEGKPNPVFSIYLGPPNQRPLVIELFQTFEGNEIRRLTPYARIVKRWGTEFQTLSREAVIGTRLGFRSPERISKFNADRLNRFIESQHQIDWGSVEKFAIDFGLKQRIKENLKDLKQHNIMIKGSNRLSFL